ncbi:hypothetical protein [Blastococcus sp. SYSU D01042]
MKKSVRVGMVAAATFAAVATSATTASAAPSGQANAAKVANPAQACASIPASLAELGIEAEGFRFSDCVRTVASRVPSVPGFGSPYDQCELMEESGEIAYPYTFYAGIPEPFPFPSLRANNREQCARALWTFHTIGTYLGPPPA